MTNFSKIFIGLITLILSFLAYWFLPLNCPEPARKVVAILIIGAMCWSFELFSAYVTALLIILLLIFGLSLQNGVNYELFLSPFANPIIFLFLGGFVIAHALRKYKVDIYLASRVLLYFGKKPYLVLLGILFVTGFSSMWISNTVTTVIMLAILHPCLEHEHLDLPFKKAMILAVPFGANIGGLGTPLGSPPNGIALASLEKVNIHIGFFKWMLIFVPLVVVLLLIASLILHYFFPTSLTKVNLALKKEHLTKQGKEAAIISGGTIVLFLTGNFHPIPEAVSALIGTFLLCARGLINKEDIKKLDWDILILLWGGLALGLASEKSGLITWLLNQPLFNSSPTTLVLFFTLLAYTLTSFMSNTAAAALLMPMALAIQGIDQLTMAIMITIACTIGMILPISTPPNALTYATGAITIKDMLKPGALIDFITLALICFGFWLINSSQW